MADTVQRRVMLAGTAATWRASPHLDYIAGMGFTQLWLNPVLENNQPDRRTMVTRSRTSTASMRASAPTQAIDSSASMRGSEASA